jgi:hypothetical protein
VRLGDCFALWTANGFLCFGQILGRLVECHRAEQIGQRIGFDLEFVEGLGRSIIMVTTAIEFI